jgi:hypothetical protein
VRADRDVREVEGGDIAEHSDAKKRGNVGALRVALSATILC